VVCQQRISTIRTVNVWISQKPELVCTILQTFLGVKFIVIFFSPFTASAGRVGVVLFENI
jgi:hypothetical protein